MLSETPLALLVLLSGTLAGTPTASASSYHDETYYAGAFCQSTGTGRDYNYFAIRNTSARTAITVNCPLIRDSPGLEGGEAVVWVKDMTTTGQVCCTLWSCDPSGSSCGSDEQCTGVSEISSVAIELEFDAPTAREDGVYTFVCTLPPMGTNYSEINSYYFLEE